LSVRRIAPPALMGEVDAGPPRRDGQAVAAAIKVLATES
jgi:hypothetical protein